jgi:hypothetical protein
MKHILAPGNEYLRRLVLIREPCDILVSLYFHETIREGKKGRDFENMSAFIWSKHGAGKLQLYWRKYFSQEQEVIKYEDLFLGPPTWGKILDWYGIEINKQAIIEADNFCKFDSIRKNLSVFERGFSWLGCQSKKFLAMENRKVVSEPKDPNAHKFRRGKVGGYVDYLDEDDIQYVRKNVPEAARWYEGY